MDRPLLTAVAIGLLASSDVGFSQPLISEAFDSRLTQAHDQHVDMLAEDMLSKASLVKDGVRDSAVESGAGVPRIPGFRHSS